MTRVRKIGPAVQPPPRQRTRRDGAARILRGTDGRPVRARRLSEPASLRLRLLRLGSVMLAFTFFAVLWTRPVRHVEVQGLWLASAPFVTSLLQDEVGRRWVTTPTRDFEAQLRRDPWIEDAQVLRAPGARIVVRIREVEPAFRVSLSGQDRVVDRKGRILPATDGMIIDALPLLDGLAMDAADPGAFAVTERAALLTLVAALDGSGWVWSEGLAFVDFADPDELLLRSSDGIEVVLRLSEAAAQLAAASAVWHELDTAGPRRIDLRFENQIVLSDSP